MVFPFLSKGERHARAYQIQLSAACLRFAPPERTQDEEQTLGVLEQAALFPVWVTAAVNRRPLRQADRRHGGPLVQEEPKAAKSHEPTAYEAGEIEPKSRTRCAICARHPCGSFTSKSHGPHRTEINDSVSHAAKLWRLRHEVLALVATEP
jgi:hypothetical protein